MQLIPWFPLDSLLIKDYDSIVSKQRIVAYYQRQTKASASRVFSQALAVLWLVFISNRMIICTRRMPVKGVNHRRASDFKADSASFGDFSPDSVYFGTSLADTTVLALVFLLGWEYQLGR